MKIAVLGTGKWGEKLVREYSALGGTEVVAVDSDERKLARIAAECGCATQAGIASALADVSIEAVHLALPNELHYPVCRQALEAGKHVLVEKPLTTNSLHALELIDLAEEKKRVFSVGHVFRFNNAVAKVKQLLRTDIGDVHAVRLTWANLEPVWERDLLFDLAPHSFDILYDLLKNEPLEIFCTGKALRRMHGAEAAHITCTYENSIADVWLDWITPVKTRVLEVTGTRGAVSADLIAQKVRVAIPDGMIREIPVQPNNTIRDEITHFINCIERDDSAINSAFVGAKVVKLIEIAQKSLRENRAVKCEAIAQPAVAPQVLG